MASLRITLLSTQATGAGGYVACLRLLQALQQQGHQARMLVLQGAGGNTSVAAVAQRGLPKLAAQLKRGLHLVRLLTQLRRPKDAFRFSTAHFGQDVSQHPWVQQAQVLHLHWVQGGFISLQGMQQLANLGKPMVYTLHDQWLFTGGCHYSGYCQHYLQACGRCPYLRWPAAGDVSHQVWLRKHALHYPAGVNYIACSQWLADLAKQSSLLQAMPVQAIPNPIDSNLWQPMPQPAARARWGLPLDKKLLLFGASRLSDPRKGYAYLLQTLALLRGLMPAGALPQLVLFGQAPPNLALPPGYTVHQLGKVVGQQALISCYAAADAYLIPSLEDNLPNTVMEAMAVGVPVAAFATGGIPSMVAHQVTGVLAPTGDAAALASGVQWLVQDAARLARLGAAARAHVLQEYAAPLVAQRYTQVYNELLAKLP